jgi:hypothetical protein
MIGIDTPALHEKAHRKTMIGQYEDAIALFDDVLATDPIISSHWRIKGRHIITLEGMKMQSGVMMMQSGSIRNKLQ